MASNKSKSWIKWLAIVCFFVQCAVLIFFIPPSNIYIIILFALSCSLLFFLLCSLFLRKKIAVPIGFFVFLILLLKATGVFDIMNFVLAASFFIGMIVLF